MFFSASKTSRFILTLGLMVLSAGSLQSATSQQSSSAEQSIQTIVQEALQAFARRELPALRNTWNSADDFTNFKLQFDISWVEYDRIAFEKVSFRHLQISSTQALVRVSFVLNTRDRNTGKSSRKSLVWDFGLRLAEGRWRLSSWHEPRSNLDTQLLQLSSRDERLKFLRQEKQLLDVPFVLALLENGDRLAQEGDPAQGRFQIEAACDAAEVLNRVEAVAQCYQVRGDFFSYQYNQPEALANYYRALDLFKSSRDLKGEQATRLRIGNARLRAGNYRDALDNYEQALVLSRQFADSSSYPLTLKQEGIAYQTMGLYANALDLFESSIKAAESIKDDLAKASALVNLGNVYYQLGIPNQAERSYQTALQIFTDFGDQQGEAGARINLGNRFTLLRDYDEAITQYERSLRIGRERQDRLIVLSSLSGLAQVSVLRGDYDAAREKFEESLELARAAGTPSEQASVLLDRGYLDSLAARENDALKNYLDAREIGLKIQDPNILFRSASLIGDLRLKQNDWNEASEAYRQAIDQIERLREHIPTSLKTSFFQQFTAPYNNLVKSSLKVGQIETAFRASEMGKARTLVEIMRAGRASETRLQPRQFEPIQLSEIDQKLFVNQPKLRILSYSLSEQGVFLFVLRPRTKDHPQPLKVYSLKSESGQDLSEKELRARVADFRQKCSHPDGIYAAEARELYQLLVSPAAEDLKDADHLVIVPSGVLLTLPFQALMNESRRHLVELYSINYAPSITALSEMLSLANTRRRSGRHSGPNSGLVMGVRSFNEIERFRGRDLRWSDEQVQKVSLLFGTRGFTGEAATERRAKVSMGTKRYIHFVTHGEVNEESPLFSAVVLKKGGGDDGWLYAQEFMTLHLNADLITLAACQTALGQEARGEGLLGLSWALFVAGATSSIVTQWEVLDVSTHELMLHFYQQLKRDKFSGKAKALQSAQLKLIGSAEFKHPYYWAPFALMGDWR